MHDGLVKQLEFEGVALHPEGVDRNLFSAQTVWQLDVALHPEGVDRNSEMTKMYKNYESRPPPGGRG